MGNSVGHDFHRFVCVESGQQSLFDEVVGDFREQAHFAAKICHSHGHGVLAIVVFGFENFSGESVDVTCRCEAGGFRFEGICVWSFEYSA